jgi:glucan-binding YG repeat protein/predicted phosphodiesterase
MFIMFAPLNLTKAEEQVNQEGDLLMQFPVLSDIHIGNKAQEERFKRALEDYQSIAYDYDAIAMVGDITNMGVEQQYDDFNRILGAYITPGAEKVITIGNHEYWEGIQSPEGLDVERYMKRFVNKTGMPGVESKVYYDKWINDYHFIAMGSEGFTRPGDYDYALISEEQYNWLETTLAVNADPAKPIFVFLHQAIDDTVYGSEQWGAGFRDTRLEDILKQYPQVILFSGHSHYLINHPRTIYQEGFTMVNTGSVAYGYTELGYPGTSQGLLVNVYSDRVEIIAREFTNHTQIQTFTVKTPFEQTYGDKQRPFFKQLSSINVDKNQVGDKVAISWDAAIDNTLVDKYLIKLNGKVIDTAYVNFWGNGTPERVTFELKNLTPDTEYNLAISAKDAWNNVSLSSLQTYFKTSKLNGWKEVGDQWLFYVNGDKATGWKFIDGYWYLFRNDGSMYTGWYTSGLLKYYLNDSGMMHIGWKEIDGKTYYFGRDGALMQGWAYDSRKWYYLDTDGTPKLGWILDGGKWYYLKADGMVAGWQQIGNSTWYYFNNSGAMEIGWVLSEGEWYYLNGSGAMQRGWVLSGGKWYYLHTSGAMKTGWILTGNKWYNMDSSGAMKTGWLLEKGKWYYLNNDGTMQTGSAVIDSVRFYFAHDGSLL